MGHIPKKRFGQNFLSVPYYSEKIADAVPAGAGDVVVEVGPGQGALSKYLAEKAYELHLIEMDDDVVPYLKKNLEGKGDYVLHHGDAKKFDYTQFDKGYHAVGNLPYNVASHIIKAMLMTAPQVKSLTCMVQKEVAERICADPGGKGIGFLSIMCGYFGSPVKLFDVPPGAFFPPPKVTSSVFQIVVDPEKTARISQEKWSDFFRMVTAGYSQRRKKLATALSSYVGSKKEVEVLLEKVGIQVGVRAEEISVEQWVELFNAQ